MGLFWWIVVGWVSCGSLALLMSLGFSASWYTRVGLFLFGPVGVVICVYVGLAMVGQGDV